MKKKQAYTRIVNRKNKPKARKKYFFFLLIFCFAFFLLWQNETVRNSFFETFQNSPYRLRSTRIKDENVWEVDRATLLADPRVIENENLMLVNSKYLLAENYVANVNEYKDSGVLMNPSMQEDYSTMSLYIRDNFDRPLYVLDSYRTAEEQEYLYQTNEFATLPGASEHQMGLALDVYVSEFSGMQFIEHEVGQFVNKNAADYGFIIRYQEGKEEITGIPYEPWHLRYVGKPHAQTMQEMDLSLEEYIEKLEIGKFYKVSEYLISRQNGQSLLIPETFQHAEISADNTGAYVLTFLVEE